MINFSIQLSSEAFGGIVFLGLVGYALYLIFTKQ